MKVLLTGPPRCGKTTLVKRVVVKLRDRYRLTGFITEEVREAGDRVGFDIVTLDGRVAPLSRKGVSGGPRVGAYTVFLEPLEEVAVDSLRDADAQAVILDEIGLMELKSPAFREEVLRLLDEGRPLLATIRRKSHPFCDMVKDRPEVEVVEVTEANRESLAVALAVRLKRAIEAQ